MSNVKFKLDRKGVGELLKSGAMGEIVSEIGSKIASNAGEGYEAKTVVRPTRVVTTVVPNTVEAHFDNLKHNILLRAMGGGK